MSVDTRATLPVLTALARGVLGELYSPEVPERMAGTLSRLASEAALKRVVGTLRFADTKAGALALTGSATPLSWLSASEAESVVKRWRASRVLAVRQLGSAMVTLAMDSYYGHPGPHWKRIGYPGPPGPPPDEPRKLHPLPIDSDEELTCDVVIVGSGAGGGCAAGVLSAAGLDVLVLERGGYRAPRDFHQNEADSMRELYLYSGTLTTTDGGIRIFAGSTLGGGTVINWTSSWKTPEPVLKEWAEVSGIRAFANGEIQESLDAVCDRLNVNLDSSAALKRDQLLEDGLKRLGWHVDSFPRNVEGCTQDEACGFCIYGCRKNAKRSSLVTYLEDAAANGTRLVVGADVRKVLVQEGRAQGVEALVGPHRLRVRSRVVIAAAGSIETPALLLRSGLGGRVGHNLRLHPATTVLGLFDEHVAAWSGVYQARYSNHLTGGWIGGYGPTLETGPAHPGAVSCLLPWESANDHRSLMDAYTSISPVGFPLRDRGSGRVKIDRSGAPLVRYKISPSDEKAIVEGVVAAGKVLEAAGARKIFTLHSSPIPFQPNGRGGHDRWADEIRRRGAKQDRMAYFTMHQMGSCAMGVDPTRSAIGAENESHEVAGLYVMDASTFPTPSGVNPMISIYGIAHRAASKLAQKLS
jgi:choline dehydrogenase-like flavoprotein